MFESSLLFIIGIAIVVKSADWFLSAAEKIGVSFRLPAFVLGVILVGFGTSLPELTTSLASVLDGVKSDYRTKTLETFRLKLKDF
jgi:Ca2+/Na+ antiporter